MMHSHHSCLCLQIAEKKYKAEMEKEAERKRVEREEQKLREEQTRLKAQYEQVCMVVVGAR
jgi:hypothetical protein